MEREKYSFIFSKNIFLIKSLNLQPLRARTYSTSTWHRDQISFNRSLRNSQTQNLTNPRVKYLTDGKKRKTQIFELKLTFFYFWTLDDVWRARAHVQRRYPDQHEAGWDWAHCWCLIRNTHTDALWNRRNICRATFQHVHWTVCIP